MGNSVFISDDQLSGFEKLIIQQKNDDEGKVVCTLVRMKGKALHRLAALQVHGFNDYCFHAETAKIFDQNGISWYGIDLRKSGRSYMQHQTFNGLQNIASYFEDIQAGLSIIKQEGATSILLMGHSLGGLIVSLFASQIEFDPYFDAVFLNSPFIEQNKDVFTKKILIPIVAALGHYFPNMNVPGGFSRFYGPSLHVNDYGEWNYNLNWKPHIAPPVKAGWVRAVYFAQKSFRKGVSIRKPVLLMFPDRNVKGNKWKDAFHYGDAVIDIRDIRKGIKHIQAAIKVKEVEKAKHDLFLSVSSTRELVYDTIINWLNENMLIPSSKDNNFLKH